MSKIKFNQHFKLKKSTRIKVNFCAAVIAISTLGAMPFLANAEESKLDTPISMSQILERVRVYQQAQGIWQTQQNIADANIKNSKLWANPSLNVERAGFANNQDQELTIGLSQPLDVFGKKKASKKIANLANEQLGLKQRIYDEQLQIIVKYLWSQVMLSEVESALLMEQLKASEQSLEVAERRFRAGSISQVDVDRVRLTHIDNIKLVQQAGLQLQIARKQLANLWGESESSNVIGHDISSFWPQKTLEKVNANLMDNLVEKTQSYQVLEAKANIDLLKAQARPNPDVSVSMKQTKTPQNQTDNQLTVGLSVPLAIFNRNQYGIQIAQAKEQLIEKQKMFYQMQNKLEVQTLLSELGGLKEQFDLVSQKQIPLAVAVQKRTLTGFQVGKLNVMDVQQATAQLHDVRIQSVQILKSAWQKSIEAESLSLGIEPSQVMAKDALSQINQNLIQDTNALPVIGMGN
ncbi:RND transporter [Acinetobacter sp. Ac_877]|uniref:TolC family protein n=1 Tax=Acinetobacter portensis TaxID=1839785 RepID=UPI00128E4A1F|nr:TolC family protein [Acinetobacter portensis]MPW42564.1 RND transporter [Acinetobacter portensis]